MSSVCACLSTASSANRHDRCWFGAIRRHPSGRISHDWKHTRNPALTHAANGYLEHPTSGALATFMTALKDAPGVNVARADLFSRAVGVLRKHAASPQLTLSDAAEKYQTQFRHRGRPVGRRRLIGTTLLVKGLEFHHAIVLDAKSLSRKELYVALTRGAKSLTVISQSRTLDPAD